MDGSFNIGTSLKAPPLAEPWTYDVLSYVACFSLSFDASEINEKSA